MCLGISSVYGDFISDVVNPVKVSADIESIDAYPNVKQISHHLASHAAGSVNKHGYTVTDPRNGYYYIGFVSDGTFSSNGLALVANEFYQADLKGGDAVQIQYSSGSFSIELSNDNANWSTGRPVTSGEIYVFGALTRYIRVLCTSDGTLTDVNIGCECSTDYTYQSTPGMTENNIWTNAVKTNKAQLVGIRRDSLADTDRNILFLTATRDDRGIWIYVKQEIWKAPYESTSYGDKWFGHDNFEIYVNTTGTGRTNGKQFYASQYSSNHGNFDIMKITTPVRQNTTYDCWYIATYKCFVSYYTMSQKMAEPFTKNSTLYLWWGSRASDTVWEACSFWNGASPVNLTTNGIMKASDGNPYNDYYSRQGDWGNQSNWIQFTDDLTNGNMSVAGSEYVIGTHVNACQGATSSTAWDDYCWKTPLMIFAKKNEKGVRTVFRGDWWGWNDNYTPTDIFTGVAWAGEGAKCDGPDGDNTTTQFLGTMSDCDIIFVVKYLGNNIYSVTWLIFPTNYTFVGRGDYWTHQTVTTDVTLGFYLNAEFVNFNIYNIPASS